MKGSELGIVILKKKTQRKNSTT